MTLDDQLRALNLHDFPVIAESAELDGERFDPIKTLARLRVRLEFYETELSQMYAFAAKWNAPMDEVSDNCGAYSAAASNLRSAIRALESLQVAR